MLVLSRKEQESLVIGDSVTVRVLEIRGRYVRLGIEAPSEVRIQRREIIVPRQEAVLDCESADPQDEPSARSGGRDRHQVLPRPTSSPRPENAPRPLRPFQRSEDNSATRIGEAGLSAVVVSSPCVGAEDTQAA